MFNEFLNIVSVSFKWFHHSLNLYLQSSQTSIVIDLSLIFKEISIVPIALHPKAAQIE